MQGIKITETVLRDAHQSLIATRMTTDEMMPILKAMDEAGYYSLEMWGGATFDAALRFLREDPWERLSKIKKVVVKTPLQMLLRGQNLVGYKHYADDVVTEFVQRAVGNGIDIVRIFDALNDLGNLETAFKAVKKAGGHAQGAIAYTLSPVHTPELFISCAKGMVEMGADSLCIKDMSGLLKPYAAFELITRLKQEVDIPIHLHSHGTTGLASMTYLKGIEAGVDGIDTAISPFALGTSQPPTESLVATLAGTARDSGMSLDHLKTIADYFNPIKEKYLQSKVLNPAILGIDINALVYQVPGGMLSNLISQLKELGQSDKLVEVLREVPRVRKEMGYPPLVTPTSQIVGTQAVLNVITQKRYAQVPNEVKDYLRGLYGRPPGEIDPELLSLIDGPGEVFTGRPGETLPPRLASAREAMKEFLEQPEDVVTYALFPQVALDYFKFRRAQKYGIEEEGPDGEAGVHGV
ncbi:MAG: oxaloacetate decarboxylase [delta proteobacterium ML8_F1]|nr:MAG: oxaloacetate decarboxylase [delta proteobacterium ML8_F1]